MATYKVIQDIEAEDKLFGPLTLKQFIFASVTLVCGYLSFWSLVNGLAFLLIIFLPPAFFFGALAFPWSKDQTTEVWITAKLRFYLRPRRRVWDQSGIKRLVTITAPKREPHEYTDGLSNTEVKSRLHALADTIDSRGWAVKNADINLQVQPSYLSGQSDRLVSSSDSPQQVVNYSVDARDDMLDEYNNPEAQKLDKLMQQSNDSHRQSVMQRIQGGQQADEKQPSQTNDYWFMRQPKAPSQPDLVTYGASPIITPGQKSASQKGEQELSAEEKQTLEKIHKQQQMPDPSNSHLKTIQPLSAQKNSHKAQNTARTNKKTANQPRPESTQATDNEQTKTPGNQAAKADILGLAQNDDLSVETIARQAKKQSDPPADEVVVSLH